MSNKVEYVVVDIETTGLDPKENYILEIGVLFLNRNLEVVDSIMTFINEPHIKAQLKSYIELADHAHYKKGDPGYELWDHAGFIVKMHRENNLIDEYFKFASEFYVGYAEAQQLLIAKMQEHFLGHNRVKLPMMGSTISFDRNFLQAYMPDFVDQFHYRNIDVSTIKTVVEKLLPGLKAKRDQELIKNGAHRTISDCWDTAMEFKFYKEHLIDTASLEFG